MLEDYVEIVTMLIHPSKYNSFLAKVDVYNLTLFSSFCGTGMEPRFQLC